MAQATKRVPNTKCRNIFCTNGTDKYSIELNNGQIGKQKWVYSCAYCRRNEIWKTVACSPSCFESYQQQVLEARAANRSISTPPIMSDMTDTEYKELMSKPISQVEAETKQELSDMGYAEEVETLGIGGTVDLINKELEDELTEDYDYSVNANISANENVNEDEQPKWTKRNRKNKTEPT